MNFKRIILIFMIFFICLQVSYAAADDFWQGGLDGIMDELSSSGPSLLKNSTRYSFSSADLVKDCGNASQYKVQLLENGEPAGPGKTVTFRINGVEYTRTTDANGTACLNIWLEPGNYIVTCEYMNFRTYNNVMVL